ncbi:RimJ/RimL family protein N-acetyltransferase [Curtobacterium flaccumfaciens]|uniref:RimJ/RimL family protein N-acetyltransferase n=1 Tax=Curtobacterium salicis TaxID=1779862 RepID=A0ABX0T6H7_9MICO|nr:GNAT family N-acetyltransferase [Curtobacterium sp. WW7]NII39778.1 RimJ/RimL family protein N-acetyltransferase [Curtobacterium sp. WW7]
MTNDDLDLVLRPFRSEDATSVVSWFRGHADALAVAGTGAPWPYRAADLVTASGGPERVPFTLVAHGDDATVLGHVAVVRVTQTTGRLARIVLAPSLRGRGRSAALVRLAMAEARALGLDELALFVVPGNEPALRAYAAVGFTRSGPDPEHPEYVRLTRRLSGTMDP